MTEATERAVLSELRGIRVALEGIAGVLLVMGQPEPEATGCLHPPDARVDFGVTGGIADWECRACGFRTVPVQGS